MIELGRPQYPETTDEECIWRQTQRSPRSLSIVFATSCTQMRHHRPVPTDRFAVPTVRKMPRECRMDDHALGALQDLQICRVLEDNISRLLRSKPFPNSAVAVRVIKCTDPRPRSSLCTLAAKEDFAEEKVVQDDGA